MASVDLGGVVALTWTSAAAGAATLAVTAPDGTAVTTTVGTADAVHTSSFTASQAGRYFVAWHATGAESYTDIVDVWPADPRFLISFADARAAISKTTTDPVNDDDLRIYIAAVTPIIEDICGPILVCEYTTSGDASKSALALAHTDVTVEAVVVDNNALDANHYRASEAAGVVYSVGRSFNGTTVAVTYSAGSGVIPPNVRLAAREEVRFLWQIGKQGGRPSPLANDSTMAWTPSGFAVPKRVIELCEPNTSVGGFG